MILDAYFLCVIYLTPLRGVVPENRVKYGKDIGTFGKMYIYSLYAEEFHKKINFDTIKANGID